MPSHRVAATPPTRLRTDFETWTAFSNRDRASCIGGTGASGRKANNVQIYYSWIFSDKKQCKNNGDKLINHRTHLDSKICKMTVKQLPIR
ncbi:hypothetical protein PV325_005467 [Microctonus aethiopoides]|nr:hypothetical protein PV325_005467 [Microctonus aethiopoides]